MQRTSGVEVRIGGQIFGHVAKIRDHRAVHWPYQSLGLRLWRKGRVDQHDVIGTGVGPKLGQHLLFRIEVFMNDGVARCFGKGRNGPVFVGSIPLPIENSDLIGQNGRARCCQSNCGCQ